MGKNDPFVHLLTINKLNKKAILSIKTATQLYCQR